MENNLLERQHNKWEIICHNHKILKQKKNYQSKTIFSMILVIDNFIPDKLAFPVNIQKKNCSTNYLIYSIIFRIQFYFRKKIIFYTFILFTFTILFMFYTIIFQGNQKFYWFIFWEITFHFIIFRSIISKRISLQYVKIVYLEIYLF